jgi:hypothetical protein
MAPPNVRCMGDVAATAIALGIFGVLFASIWLIGKIG